MDKDGKVQETFADQAEALRGKGETLDDEEIQKKVTEFHPFTATAVFPMFMI